MMKRVSRTSWRWTAAAVAVWAGAGAPGAPLTAQDVRVQARQECRCVDRDGNEIENCTCIRVPRIEMLRGMDMFGPLQRRAQIGVWLEAQQADDVDASGGVLITRVQEDGPAARAGLAAGDVVLRVGGRSLQDPLADAEAEQQLDVSGSMAAQRFMRLVGELEPGVPVELEVLRDGRTRTLTVTPTEAESRFPADVERVFRVRVGEGPPMAFDEDALRMELRHLEEGADRLRVEMERLRGPEGPGAGVWTFRMPEGEAGFRFPWDSIPGQSAFTFFGGDPCFALDRGQGRGLAALAGAGNCVDGVEFMELNADLAEYFDASEGGVLVTEVSEASELGLRAGDVLLAIDGRDVEDPSHVRRILSSYDDDEEVRLLVIRKGREMEVLGRRRNP